MDSQSLTNVLGILRLLKARGEGVSTLNAIRDWVGHDASPVTILKFAGYVLEEANLARTVISNSQLSDEAKDGVIATIDGVATAFSIEHLQSTWNGNVKDVAAAVANFSILLSVIDVKSDVEIPQEANELIAEIDAMVQSFNDPELDPAVRDIGRRHLEVLSTLLRHIPIFGVEPSLTTYFELLTKLRRADIGSSEAAHKKVSPLVEKIKGWAKVLEGVDKAVNSGARLLKNADKAQELLKYLPDGM